MAETIDAATKLIEERLSQIEAERKRLQGALDSLSQGPAPTRSRSGEDGAAAGKQQRRRRQRAPRGQREQELLASIRASPANTVADHARQLGVAPSQIYALIRRLSGEGKIEKTASGFDVTAESSTGS